MTQVSFMDKAKSTGGRVLAVLQKVGKSLVFPIAVLPAAAILMRMGELIKSYGMVDGSLAEQFAYWVGIMIATPGNAVFGNLPAIFAIGVGFGFSKDKRGEAALVAFVAYMTLHMLVDVEATSLSGMIYSGTMVEAVTGKSEALYLIVPESGAAVWFVNTGVFGGISAGLMTAWIYNKYSDIRLHPALGFFSGRRFVPMITLLVMIPFSLITAIVWPWFNVALVKIAEGVTAIPALGAGVYATINRLLIPFGLHQVLNTYFWFQMPVQGTIASDLSPLVGLTVQQVTDMGHIVVNSGLAGGQNTIDFGDEVIVFGDITAFSMGVEGAGIFQAGFFPVMMFGLPAVGMAIANNADKEHKKAVWAFMISAASVTFLTGITEPLEFAFAFVAPLLYVIYSIISGLVAAAVVATGTLTGFGFSAGLIDLLISMPMAASLSTGVAEGYMHLLWIILIGVGSMPIYYFTVDLTIKHMDIATPGRKGNLTGVTTGNDDDEGSAGAGNVAPKWTKMAEETLALVGVENIKEIDNCITRVRLTVKDNSHITREAAAAINYQGYVKTGTTQAHFIIGPESEIIANEMRRLIKEGNNETPKVSSTSKPVEVKATEAKETKAKVETKKEEKPAKAKKGFAFKSMFAKPKKEKETKKKEANKKAEAKKAETKKVEAKKPAAKKTTAKKETAKKPAAKKTTAKKETAKKPAAKKATPKKEVAKKPAAKKTTTKTSTDLNKKSIDELKDMAKNKGVKGYTKMKKADLIKALEK